MSMHTSIGAEAAATDIIRYIDTLIAVRELAPGSQPHEVLLNVRKEAESIKRVAKEGWY
jgi:hypothetical protein